MIKIDKIETWGLIPAIRGMRNSHNSWDKSDSTDGVLGEKDLKLMQRLYRAGESHRKYLRQMFISCDILAPLYWWKEFDQYKVGVTTNSTSTMHTLSKRPLTIDDFSHDRLVGGVEGCGEKLSNIDILKFIIDNVNGLIQLYNKDNEKCYWYSAIQLLPSSFNQLRTVTMSYENAINMINQRSNHRLDEWLVFCNALIDAAPHIKDLYYA